MFVENAKVVVKNLFDVESWVCVATGGGTGIGLMISQALANNEAKVYITSRRQGVLEHTAKQWGSSLVYPKGKHIPVNWNEINKHNAGISDGKSDIEKGDRSAKDLAMELFGEDQASWENVYRTNAIGCFFTTTAFLPLLKATSLSKSQHTGSVINITSASGITRTTQYRYKYNVSKAAAIHLIGLNNIAPGIFPSEMTTGSFDELNGSQIPVGCLGHDEDIAHTLAIDSEYLLQHHCQFRFRLHSPSFAYIIILNHRMLSAEL
ncbi:NAD(P)-binding protein [Suillus placidus]|uniref:NAD(P)-binding protein n=1 Tax=Suillus placidus TaxID=48579 RepID=A0A9P7D7E9_9AGAM|nr:NAD(P)-binding protein [Suillus placidus]